jgi:hypothetical protein
MQDTPWSAGLVPQRTAAGYFLNNTLRFATKVAFLHLDGIKRFRASFDPSLEKNAGRMIRFCLIRQSSAVLIVFFIDQSRFLRRQARGILEIFERATMTRIGRC